MSGYAASPSTRVSSSAGARVPPVGLAGLLRMISRVLGVIRDSSSWALKENSFSSRSGIGIAEAPE